MSASQCPHCAITLEMKKTEGGVVYGCKSCGGFSIGLGILRRKMDEEVISNIWRKAVGGKDGAKCPTCPRPMKLVEVALKTGTVEVDICSNCYHVWFDQSELEKLPRKEKITPIDPGRPPQRPVQTYTSTPDYNGYRWDYDAVDLALDALDLFFRH